MPEDQLADGIVLATIGGLRTSTGLSGRGRRGIGLLLVEGRNETGNELSAVVSILD